MRKKLLKKVRVRFAPSPTGPLHLGGLRTALYNYLFAIKNQGSFVLRIEDTDTERFVPESESYISQVLEWCGIRPDECPFFRVSHGPYRQSERKYIYIYQASQLLKKGFAYYAFDSNETLEKIRNKFQKNGEKFLYNSIIREKMENSLSLSYKEVHRRLEKPYVIRFKTPYKNECLEIYDEVRGKIHINTSTLDDKILLKSDGMPSYHLANVIDDHLMHISHVIRGEEWLPSMGFHCLLYRSFGWEIPKFVHLPLILNPRGKGKLSKRDKGKFPIFPIQWRDPETGIVLRGYREYGYFPEAIINMLAFLGWNPGGVEEFFLMNDLVRKFSLEKVGKSSVYLSLEKARWFNHQYLKKKTLYEISALFRKNIEKHHILYDENYIRKVLESVRKRVCFINEIWEQSSYFFICPKSYDKCYLQKIRSSRYCFIVKDLKKLLESVEDFKESSLKIKIKDFSKQHNISSVFFQKKLRLALVGSLRGVGIFFLMEMIGKRETLSRVECFYRACNARV